MYQLVNIGYLRRGKWNWVVAKRNKRDFLLLFGFFIFIFILFIFFLNIKGTLLTHVTQESSRICPQARLDPGIQALRGSGFPLSISGSASSALAPFSGRFSNLLQVAV